MGVKTNVQGVPLSDLKTALQYADDDLGITVATASYGDICDALADFFPDTPEISGIASSSTPYSYGGTTWYASYAIDGNFNTCFCGAGASSNYLTVELKSSARIKKIKYTTAHATNAEVRTGTLTIEVSDDNVNWTTISTLSSIPFYGRTYSINTWQGEVDLSSNPNARGKYVRFTCACTGYSGLREVYFE